MLLPPTLLVFLVICISIIGTVISSKLAIQEYQDVIESYNLPKSSGPILIRQPLVAFTSPSSVCLGITPPVRLRFGILNNKEQGFTDSDEESVKSETGKLHACSEGEKDNDDADDQESSVSESKDIYTRLSNVDETQFHIDEEKINASFDIRLSNADKRLSKKDKRLSKAGKIQPPAEKKIVKCIVSKAEDIEEAPPNMVEDQISADHEINACIPLKKLSKTLSLYLLSQSRNDVKKTNRPSNISKIVSVQLRPKGLDDILSLIEEDSYFINHTKYYKPVFGIIALRKEVFDRISFLRLSKQISNELLISCDPFVFLDIETKLPLYLKHKDDHYPCTGFFRSLLVVPDSLCPPNTFLIKDTFLNEKQMKRKYHLGHTDPKCSIGYICSAYTNGIISLMNFLFRDGYMGHHADTLKKLYLYGALKDEDWLPALNSAMCCKIEKFRPYCVFLLHHIFSPLLKERGLNDHPLLVGSPSFKTVSFDLLIEMSINFKSTKADIRSTSRNDLRILTNLIRYIEHDEKLVCELVEEKSKEPFVHPNYLDVARYIPNTTLHYIHRFIDLLDVDTFLPLLAENMLNTPQYDFEKTKKVILFIFEHLRKKRGEQVVLELAQKMFKSEFIKPHSKSLIVSNFGTSINYHGVNNGIKSNDICDFLVHCYVHKENLKITDFVDVGNMESLKKADLEKAFCKSIGYWELRRPGYSPFNLVLLKVYFLLNYLENSRPDKIFTYFEFPLVVPHVENILLSLILSNDADTFTLLEFLLESISRLQFLEELQVFELALYFRDYSNDRKGSRNWMIKKVVESLAATTRTKNYYNELILFKYTNMLNINTYSEFRCLYTTEYLYQLRDTKYSSTDEEIVDLVEGNRSYDFEIDLSEWLSIEKSNTHYDLSDYAFLVSGLAFLNFGIPFRYARIQEDIDEAPADLNGMAFHLEFIITRYATLIKPDIKKMFDISFSVKA